MEIQLASSTDDSLTEDGGHGFWVVMSRLLEGSATLLMVQNSCTTWDV